MFGHKSTGGTAHCPAGTGEGSSVVNTTCPFSTFAFAHVALPAVSETSILLAAGLPPVSCTCRAITLPRLFPVLNSYACDPVVVSRVAIVHCPPFMNFVPSVGAVRFCMSITTGSVEVSPNNAGFNEIAPSAEPMRSFALLPGK